MKVQVHDFSGHPFQAELARELATLGHEVEHVSSAEYVSGKGHLQRLDGDSPRLSFSSISVDRTFEKYHPVQRLRFEVAYARAYVARLREQRPDVVIACNLPLVSQYIFTRFARRSRLPYVLWHQDIYSMALGEELHRRFPVPVASVGARAFRRMEAVCARRAAHVVAIGEAFREVYPGWRVPPERVSVIPNWAPLGDVFPSQRDSSTAAELFGDAPGLRLLYAGTLGRKHNPDLLLDVLRGVGEHDVPVSAVVVSEGAAADELAARAAREQLPLSVVDFQPAERLPDVLGSADVLVALLEPEATKFSIPSKVLTYMAAGRPILGLMSAENPAAVNIMESGGRVVDASPAGAAEAASWLATLTQNPELVSDIGGRTRATAERTFDIASVTVAFDRILRDAHACR